MTIWSLEEKKSLQELSGHYGEICDIAFSRDGEQLASTSRAYFNDRWVGDLKVWDVSTGRRKLSMPSHTWWDAAVAFHPSGRQIATTGKDHTLIVIDPESGRVERSVATNGWACFSMEFTSDGKRLLAPLMNRATLFDTTPETVPFGNVIPVGLKQDAAEESAARWVLEQGGQLQVLVDDVAPLDVNRVEDLPSDPYRITRIILSGNETIGDNDLAILRPLLRLTSVRLELKNITDDGLAFLEKNPELRELFLNGTQVSEKWLKRMGAFKKLQVLHLNDTPVTPSGLVSSLQGLPLLENLELHRTSLDDATLSLLSQLKKIKVIGASGTKVTDVGVADVKKVFPNLIIGR